VKLHINDLCAFFSVWYRIIPACNTLKVPFPLRKQLLERTESTMTAEQRAQSLGGRTKIPNWGIAATVLLVVAGTFYYTLHAVGTTDIDTEVQKVLDSQKAAGKAK
jgi:hypothetical protein